MKVRVRVSKGRPAISLSIEEAASLGSLKEQLTSRVLISGDFVLSLNGNDGLDESQTLHELGIVNGDLLHVVVARGERSGQPRSVSCGGVAGLKTTNQLCSCSHVTNQTEVHVANGSPEYNHVTDSCNEYSSNGLHTSGAGISVERGQNTALGVEHAQSPDMECGHNPYMACSQNTLLNPDMECGQNIRDAQCAQNAPLNPNMECGQDSQPPFHSEGQATIKASDVTASRGGHFEEFLRGQLPPDAWRGGCVLSLALHALMLDSGFMEQSGHTPSTAAMGVLKRFYSSALYIQHYKWKQESKRQHRRWVAMAMSDPLYRPPNMPVAPPPGFGGFPGVIGGDYDYLPHPLVPPPRMDPFTHPSLPRPRFNPYSPLPDHRLGPPRSYSPPWSSTPPFLDGRSSRGRRGSGDVRLGRHGGGVFGGMRIF